MDKDHLLKSFLSFLDLSIQIHGADKGFILACKQWNLFVNGVRDVRAADIMIVLMDHLGYFFFDPSKAIQGFGNDNEGF